MSLGNKGDVSANDLLNYWYDDPATEVVCLYTESFGNPRKFGRVARRVSRRKPIVAVKSGRGSPDDVAADALYLQAGVIRVDTVRELFDVGRVLAGQPLPERAAGGGGDQRGEPGHAGARLAAGRRPPGRPSCRSTRAPSWPTSCRPT